MTLLVSTCAGALWPDTSVRPRPPPPNTKYWHIFLRRNQRQHDCGDKRLQTRSGAKKNIHFKRYSNTSGCRLKVTKTPLHNNGVRIKRKQILIFMLKLCLRSSVSVWWPKTCSSQSQKPPCWRAVVLPLNLLRPRRILREPGQTGTLASCFWT